MSRLSDLYKAMETLRKEGVSTEDLEQKVGELEEEIIKKEILPVVTETIAPALKQVQRELVLVVDYIPNNPISVHLSRKTNITELLDAKIMEIDPQAEHKEGKKHEKPIERLNGKSLLRVTFPDGKVIADKKAKITFAETIKRIGLMKVRNLGISFCHVPLVSNTLDKKYGSAQIPVGDGLYVMTHSSTHDKKKQLDRISHELGCNLIVEEFTPVNEFTRRPVINEDASQWNLPIKIQFQSYLSSKKAESTANSYTSTLDNAVREWIKRKVDERADSVFSYTTSEDVRLCIDMLNASADYVAENDRKHHSMSAALNQYLQFIEEWEKRFK